MSSAINHGKRSHRSEAYKRGTFAASSRRALYSPANQRKQGLLRGIFGKLKRNTVSGKSGKQREARTNDDV